MLLLLTVYRYRFLVCFTCFFVISHCSFIAVARADKADLVLVKKSERKMYLYSGDAVIKTYSIALGKHPEGHKQREGDFRTPEGKYLLIKKNTNSSYHKSIKISYPNEEDSARAKEKGYSPGGEIMIHGQKNGFGWFGGITQKFDWTRGCIAVTNKEIDEIWELVDIGTPIEIVP